MYYPAPVKKLRRWYGHSLYKRKNQRNRNPTYFTPEIPNTESPYVPRLSELVWSRQYNDGIDLQRTRCIYCGSRRGRCHKIVFILVLDGKILKD